MCRWQQLGRLGSRDSYWADWVSEPSYWRVPPCTYCVYLYIFPLVDVQPAQPERRGGWGCWCCLCSCECSESLWSVWPATYLCVSVVCACPLCACACWEHIFSLATSWTLGQGGAAASPLLGDIFLHEKQFHWFYHPEITVEAFVSVCFKSVLGNWLSLNDILPHNANVFLADFFFWEVTFLQRKNKLFA